MYLLKVIFNEGLADLVKSNSVSVETLRTNFKSIIEDAGVPHTEVGTLVFNGINVKISDILKESGTLLVHPKESENLRGEAQFILDVHLGTLAKYLRMLGFDTLYENDYEDREIVETAMKEKRIILTRDRGILKRSSVEYGYLIRSFNPRKQLHEVLKRYMLYRQISPLTRCLMCNGRIVPISKKEIMNNIPKKSREAFDEFYICEKCHRVYWKGSHYERFKEIIEEVKEISKSF